MFRLRYDIAHIHTGGDLTPRVLALCFFCSLIPRKCTFFTFHSGGYPSFPAAKKARPWSLRGFIFRRLEGIIVVNRELADVFYRLGVPRDRVRVIVPYAFQPVETGGGLPVPLQGFFEQHDPVLTTVGLLEPEYDLGLQIDAFARIREKFPKAGLLIIGAGSLERTLQTRIESKHYANHVLLAGDVPHDVTLRAIAASRAILRTTLYDGDSISVREALDFGVPVITTETGMRPAGVRLIPISDSAALCNAIEAELSRTASRIGRSGTAADHRNVQAVLDFYEFAVSHISYRTDARFAEATSCPSKSENS